ncbi:MULTISPECIES: hypothetical protein [Gordonibacter]|uniref:Uncharacterized protein n=1 Tax=Gordonibacter faecis TaxID=3047475 RepID=A0ABT7DUG2_9ACTN|nr:MULTISPECIES: hypothetical protein [unclassified Gordonibacter]MDJ1651740.1 hypothetical protein [Gordonibacter sp. KGMB12511]HIW75724.1 hypothetical protein [Candidatus Gordonibacter avicola]
MFGRNNKVVQLACSDDTSAPRSTPRRSSIALAALIVCISALVGTGSLAYFTTSDASSQHFMVASADADNPESPGDLFSISLNQSDGSGNASQQGVHYTNMVPGLRMTIDPSVTNTGKHAAWLRMNATLTKASAWKEALAKHGLMSSNASAAEVASVLETYVFAGMDKNTWQRGEVSEARAQDGTLRVTYYFMPALTLDTKAQLMEAVCVPDSFDAEDVESFSGFNLVFSADAIQYANTGTSAREAFANCWE